MTEIGQKGEKCLFDENLSTKFSLSRKLIISVKLAQNVRFTIHCGGCGAIIDHMETRKHKSAEESSAPTGELV